MILTKICSVYSLLALACNGSAQTYLRGAPRRRLDSHNFKHQKPTIEFDIEDVCPGQPFNGTMRVIGAGGSNINTPPLDVVIAIDTSGSMYGDPCSQAKDAATSFVEKMAAEAPSESMAGIVAWDTTAHALLNLTNPPNDTSVLDFIEMLKCSGGTNLDNGLLGAIDVHDDSPRQDTEEPTKAIIFLTDGVGPYTNCTYANSPAAQAKAKGITIYSIGIGSAIAGPLIDMATCTGGLSYTSIESDTLDQVFDDIYQAIEDSTVPYNINVNLVPTTEVEYLKLLGDHVSPNSSHVLLNIDDSNGLPAGSTISIAFQGKINVNTNPSFLVEPSSTYFSKDKDGTDFKTHYLNDTGGLKIDPNCYGTTTEPTPKGPTTNRCKCSCPPKSSKPSKKKTKKQNKKSAERALKRCKCECPSASTKRSKKRKKNGKRPWEQDKKD